MPYTNQWPGVLADLRGLIKEAWPDIGYIFEALTIERYNWANMIERSKMTPPYAVIQIPDVGEVEDFGLDNHAMLDHWTIWYICRTGSGTKVADVRAKLKALMDVMVSQPVPLSTCQVMGRFRFYGSDQSPIASTTMRYQMNMHGGGLGFDLMFGEISNQ